MQQTLSYSSSPSPTLISTIAHPIRSPNRPQSTDTATSKPAIISVDYSYDPNSIMSPSAHSNSNYDRDQRSSEPMASEVLYLEKASASNQPYSSLFGDPVPPPQPEDYFGTAAFETIRAGSVDMPSSEEDTLLAAVALNSLMGNDGRRRLFSNVPYTNISTCRTQMQSQTQTQTPTRTPSSTLLPIPRLQPPDIQILPNSSGGSSSEQLDSPNFMLLTPQDIVNKPDVYELEYEQAEQALGATFVSSTSEQEPQSRLRPISGSYSSPGLDWYRPATQHFAEFSRIPKLRPSSKMVMSMKHEEMPLSPLATMLQDSNGSSSGGEEQVPNVEQQQASMRSPVPNRNDTIPTPTMDMDIILSPQQYLQQQKRELMRRESYNTSYGPDTPRTPSVSHSQVPESGNEAMTMTPPEESIRLQAIGGEMSPVVIKDLVSTGGDYRVGETRLHKKSSFTILSVRSPKSSLTHSPSTTPIAHRRPRVAAARHASIQSTTTSSNAVPPPVRTRRKSMTGSRLPQLPKIPTNISLPSHLATDDSPRPSVQFNMSGRYSPSKLAKPTKGILQQRDSLTSSVDTYTPRVQRRGSINAPSGLLEPFGQRIKSMETLPLITDPYRSAIPRFHRSAMELDMETAVIPPGSLPRPLKPNPNPTRKQRGLLGVVNREENFPPTPPRSNWLSLDDLVMGTRLTKSNLEPMRIQARRRSSSTSPERRSSTQTASDRRSSNLSSITTSDMSFRRPSLSTLPSTTQRRKSIYLPGVRTTTTPRRQPLSSKDLKQHNKRAKIAKPSTLSPIIGTPNKDIPQSPLHGSAYEAAHRDTPSELSVRRDSISRIPVRSRQGSHPSSRSNSPYKDFNSLSLLSGRNSRASNSRSPSQTTVRSSFDTQGIGAMDIRLTPTRFNGSRPVSRGPPSRPNSRMAQANDLAVNSRGNSRANSRANSQTNSLANSRANSRLSVRSSLRSSSVSPATMSRNSRRADTTPNRRKSVSTSPKSQINRGMLGRKMSLSPVAKQGKQSPKRDYKEATLSSQRRNSRSRIPTSVSQSIRAKSSSPSKKPETRKMSAKSRSPQSPKGKKSTTVSAKSTPRNKSNKAESAKKKTSLVSKPDTGVKRTGTKNSSTVTAKKQPTIQTKAPQQQKQKQEKKPVQSNSKPDKPVTKNNAAIGANGSSGLPKPLTRVGSQQNTKKTNTESMEAKTKHKGSPEKVENTKDAKDNSADSTKPLAVHVGNAVLQAAEAIPAVRNEVNASATGGIKRQGSNMSTLVRMSSRLSLISNKKRVDSAQTRKVATVPELTQETEVPKGQAAQLGTAGHQLTSTDGATSSGNSQKALESETPKTINDNLTGPKIHDTEMGFASESGNSPTPSSMTMVAKPHDATSRLDTADGSNAQRNAAEIQKSPLPPTQPIEASISVLNATDPDTATAQVSGHAVSAKPEIDNERANAMEDQAVDFEHATPTPGSRDDFQVDDKRLSPDGQGGSTAGSGGNAKSSSQEFLKDDVAKGGICRCCTTLCMRFRRSHCMRCCGRRQDRLHGSVEEQPVLSSARSSASTTTQMEIIDETKSKNKKKSRCWPMSNCCKSCRKKPVTGVTVDKETKVEQTQQSVSMQRPKQQSKCGLCLRKIFCCRSVNKVDPITGDETELRKCCFCIPCRRKRAAVASTEPKVAWRDRDPELGINASDAAIVEGSSVAPSTTAPTEDMAKTSCCRRFWLMFLCCRKKPRRGSDARRQSIKAPPTSEDTRRKLHVDLVEYTSKMKGAIPVLPLYLAWFCAFCNVIFPGLGTLLSGLFCLCVGIPRFSQYDSARARIGSFIINIIVAVAQFFCVLFCFVGWGWSIWWGTIMLRCAKKLSKIKKVERLELEEEQRQAELAAAAGAHRGEAETAKT